MYWQDEMRAAQLNPLGTLMHIKAIIFDIDGTLLNSVDLHAASWVETFENFGISTTFADVRTHIGEGADRLLPAFIPEGTPPELSEAIERFRSALFKERYLQRVQPFPAVQLLLERLRSKGLKIALASSCTSEEVGKYKEIASISSLTDCDITSDDAGSSKPAPDIFKKAVQRLFPIEPHECLVIGDTKYDGIAARAAHIPFIGVRSGGTPDAELRQAGAPAGYDYPQDLLENWLPTLGRVAAARLEAECQPDVS